MKPWIWMSVKSLPREYRYKNSVTLQLWYDLVRQRILGNANDAQHIVLMASETIGRNVQCALSARLLFCVRINKTRKFNMASRTNQFGFTNLTRQSLFLLFEQCVRVLAFNATLVFVYLTMSNHIMCKYAMIYLFRFDPHSIIRFSTMFLFTFINKNSLSYVFLHVW